MTSPATAPEVGTVLGPSRPHELAAEATLDAEGNARAALAAYLAVARFRRWGGDDPHDDVAFGFAQVLEEWPEADRELEYPAASIIPAGEPMQDGHSLSPTPLVDTLDCYGEGTVLWKLAELVLTFQVDVWATEALTRAAVAARLPGLFAPGEDGGRVVLAGSPRYFGRPVRASLQSMRRMDTVAGVWARERRLMARVRCETPVVELRRAARLEPDVRMAAIGEDVEV